MSSNAQKKADLKKWGELLDAEAGIDVSNWQPPAIDLVAASAYPERASAGFDMNYLPEAAPEEEGLDNHRNAPRPEPACLYGLVGDVARAGSATTEANPYAVAANFIAYMGCAVGRGPYMAIGNTWHHARMFMLHIGRSSRGRKGDATKPTARIDAALRKLRLDIAPQVHTGGLSSREGLVFLIHDGYKNGKDEVAPILDKRLLVIESEFVNVLQQSKREGNTLSAAIRDCWDGVSMRPATKTNVLWATDPHACLSAAVTPSELLGAMATRELTNGFANRFFMLWAERPRLLAFPTPTPQADIDALALRVLEVLEFCKAHLWEQKDHMRVDLSQAARKRYEALYHSELNDNTAGERITALIERRAPMLLRLSMLFALCDLTATVEVHHINAALAWIRYSVDSVKFVFGSAADEAQVAKTNDATEKIMLFLTEQKRVTRKQITTDCFKGHVNKSCIDAALDELLSCNPPRITVQEDRSGAGRPTKFYELAANKANYANNEHPCGFAGDFASGELSELSPECELSPGDSSQVRIVRELSKQPQTRTSADCSLSSHSSRPNPEMEIL